MSQTDVITATANGVFNLEGRLDEASTRIRFPVEFLRTCVGEIETFLSLLDDEDDDGPWTSPDERRWLRAMRNALQVTGQPDSVGLHDYKTLTMSAGTWRKLDHFRSWLNTIDVDDTSEVIAACEDQGDSLRSLLLEPIEMALVCRTAEQSCTVLRDETLAHCEKAAEHANEAHRSVTQIAVRSDKLGEWIEEVGHSHRAVSDHHDEMRKWVIEARVMFVVSMVVLFAGLSAASWAVSRADSPAGPTELPQAQAHEVGAE
ncbi:hypothetical protein [Stratiformator vulcanicus]|uniref:Uncharacterized protein n=1 Tax=Stratiformator vulcanicus TaxID=2527980 RepID=A0A517R795_9PLAN|nr:hypothetical protein [Stratiformator vulcanicus]QDT39758.1 hypothetical protein Pan189_41670 [Stratiformator vulcanicus]